MSGQRGLLPTDVVCVCDTGRERHPRTYYEWRVSRTGRRDEKRLDKERGRSMESGPRDEEQHGEDRTSSGSRTKIKRPSSTPSTS